MPTKRGLLRIIIARRYEQPAFLRSNSKLDKTRSHALSLAARIPLGHLDDMTLHLKAVSPISNSLVSYAWRVQAFPFCHYRKSTECPHTDQLDRTYVPTKYLPPRGLTTTALSCLFRTRNNTTWHAKVCPLPRPVENTLPRENASELLGVKVFFLSQSSRSWLAACGS